MTISWLPDHKFKVNHVENGHGTQSVKSTTVEVGSIKTPRPMRSSIR